MRKILLLKMKLYCLQRYLLAENDFDLFELKSKTGEKAWAEIEETIATNNSQEWLLTIEEIETLRKLFDKIDMWEKNDNQS